MVKLENYGALSVVILSFETPQMWYRGALEPQPRPMVGFPTLRQLGKVVHER